MDSHATLAGSTSVLLLILALAIAVLPLVSALGLAVFGKRVNKSAASISIIFTAAAFVAAAYLFTQIGQQVIQTSLPWLSLQAGSKPLVISASVYIDHLAAMMLVLASFISLLVQLYSKGYLKDEPNQSRYFASLSLFTAAMLAMVMTGNLLQLFIGWELVGFSSYLLIGFWRERKSAGKGALTAFLVNRVADLALLFGLLMVWYYFGTFELATLKQALAQAKLEGAGFMLQSASKVPTVLSGATLSLLGFCLFAGCVGKSAQFPLQVWLPGAMSGPTPVSALLHAATMVAAGVYLLARCYFFFNPSVLVTQVVLGCITLLLGSVAALGQQDIKRVLAYSTIAQLGYMVMAMGCGAYTAALLHLATHAFFKAALFLLAGIVVHYTAHTLHTHSDAQSQNMRNMGGLYKILPFTFTCYLLATAALTGVPFFSGFLSKEAILAGTWSWAERMSANGATYAFLVPAGALFGVFLTACYMSRQIWLVFLKRPSAKALQVASPSRSAYDRKYLLILPAGSLAVFSLAVFFSINPFSIHASWLGHRLSQDYLAPYFNSNPVYQHAYLPAGFNEAPAFLPWLSVGLVICGVLFTLIWARNIMPAIAIAALTRRLSVAFTRHTEMMLQFYIIALVQPIKYLARVFAATDSSLLDKTINMTGKSFVVLSKVNARADRFVIDGFLHLLVSLAKYIGSAMQLLHRGRLQQFYVVGLTGLVLLVILLLHSLH